MTAEFVISSALLAATIISFALGVARWLSLHRATSTARCGQCGARARWRCGECAAPCCYRHVHATGFLWMCKRCTEYIEGLREGNGCS